MGELDRWMDEHGVKMVWVGVDNPGAEAFYRACGFERVAATYMERKR